MVPPAACPSLPPDGRPLMESCDPSVCFGGLGSGTFGSPRSPSTSGPREPGPWSFPSSTAPRSSFGVREHIHSWVFTLLQGVTEDHPSAASRFHASGFRQHCPSHGVLVPPAVASTKEPALPAVPPAGTLRLQGSGPLDALLPFEPSRRCRRGRSWDSNLQGFRPPGDPALFRADPSPPDRCSSEPRHASSALGRTRPSSEVITPREGPGKPSSGLSSRRESSPLRLRFRVAHRTDALLVFILPRALSTVIRRATVASRPLTRFAPIDSLASLDRRCASASCRIQCRLVSLETAGPPEVPSLFRPVSSRDPAALGY